MHDFLNMVTSNSCILCLTWGLVGSRCSYHDDRYLTTVLPVDGSSGLPYPMHHKRFAVKMFTFVDQNTFTPQKDTVQSFTLWLFFFFCFFVLKWQFEISMTNVQLAIFFRSSSIVLQQCVIPAAQTLVNSHATGNVSGSSTVTHGSDFTLLIILSPAIIIVLVTKVVTIRASMYISGFLHYLKFKTNSDFFFFFF